MEEKKTSCKEIRKCYECRYFYKNDTIPNDLRICTNCNSIVFCGFIGYLTEACDDYVPEFKEAEN